MAQTNLPGSMRGKHNDQDNCSGGEGKRQLRAKYLSPLDIRLHEENDPILETLPPSAKPEYLKVRREVRQGLVEGLAKTVRWQNFPDQISPEFQENDLDHVVSLLGWCNDIERNYPALYQAVCGGDRQVWHDFLAMITMHDIGEIGVGDLVMSLQKTPVGLRRAKLEPRWAKYALCKSLEPQQAKKLISIYDRFEQPADDDTQALAAKMLDRGQASANVALHVIPYNKEKPNLRQSKFVSSQSDTLRFAERLASRLESPQALSELQAFLKEKVIDHFNAQEIPEIGRLQEEVRQRFPTVYSEDWLMTNQDCQVKTDCDS